MNSLRASAALSLLVPALLLAGAYASELMGLVPCEMCWWQRWAHFAALVPALGAVLLAFSPLKARGDTMRVRRLVTPVVILAAACILVSGIIGGYHAGVEYGWWEGHTACTANLVSGLSTSEMLDQIMKQPLVRCDQPQWTLLGISLAGYNFLASTLAAIAIMRLALRARGRA